MDSQSIFRMMVNYFMQIKYKDVLLRDYRESDIDDEVRWNTVDTQWGLWDAPWEKEDYFRTFDPEAYRQRRLDWLRTKAPKGEELRWFLEIDTAQGVVWQVVAPAVLDEHGAGLDKAEGHIGIHAFRHHQSGGQVP